MTIFLLFYYHILLFFILAYDGGDGVIEGDDRGTFNAAYSSASSETAALSN